MQKKLKNFQILDKVFVFFGGNNLIWFSKFGIAAILMCLFIFYNLKKSVGRKKVMYTFTRDGIRSLFVFDRYSLLLAVFMEI